MSPKSLKILHGIAGFAHFAQFAAILGLVIKDQGQDWPIISQGFTKPRAEYEYALAGLLPAFPALSSLNHFVAFATTDGWYDQVRRDQVNPLRWAEYSVSAGVMLWIIATLSGIVEIRTLVTLALLNAALQYVGYLVEKGKAENNPNVKSLLWLGFALHVTIWVQIFISFYTVIGEPGTEAPKGIYSIIIVMFLLFTSFGILSALWVYDKIKSFDAVETGYIVLSLVSKTFLTWMVYFGVLRSGERFETT